MGFWKNLGKSLGEGIGKIIEVVGDTFNIEPLSDAGIWIQKCFAKKIASEASYNKQESTVNSTVRLNEILISFLEDANKKATLLEDWCIQNVTSYFNWLIDTMIENNQGTSLATSRLETLKDGRKNVASMIRGSIKNPLAKRMSLDDAECLKILKMDTGKDKEQAINNFENKVIKEAANNLIKNIHSVLKEQENNIIEFLDSVAEEEEKAIVAMQKHINDMLQNNKSNQSSKEMMCVNPLYIMKISDHVCSILN